MTTAKAKTKTKAKPRKLAIVGFSEKSRDLAPFDDPEWEIWGCNHVFRYVPRLDAVFEIHKIGELKAKYGEKNHWPEYAEFLRTTDAVVWMQDESPEFPAVKRLPIEEIEAEFGYELEHYEFDASVSSAPGPAPRKLKGRSRSQAAQFKSTLSYMVAMAIRERRFEEIAIYGVDMTIEEEWHFQRHNFGFFLGWCRGAGIKLTLPDCSALLNEAGMRLYGYEESKADKYRDLIGVLGEEVKRADADLVELETTNEQMTARIQEMVGAKKYLSALAKDEQFNGHREFFREELKSIEREEIVLRRKQSQHLAFTYETSGARKKTHKLMQLLGYHNRGELPDAEAKA